MTTLDLILRSSICIVICTSTNASLAISQTQSHEVPKYTIEQFLETINYRGASFSPDNTKILVSSDESGVFNAYSITIETGDKTRLTQSMTDSILAIGYFPNDERFLYSADQGGNELNHIFVRTPDGTVQDLTPGENLKAQFANWSRDDKYFYLHTNERDQRYFDVYRYRVDDLSRELVFQNDDGFFPGPVSPDGNLIALNKIDTRDNSDVYLYNLSDQSTRHLTPHDGDINFSSADFSPDGKYLLMTTDQDHEFKYLIKYDLQTAQFETVMKPDWDVVGAAFSKRGKYLGIGINEDSRAVFKFYEYSGMRSIELPSIPGASVTSVTIASDESCIAMYATSGKMPRDLMYYDFGPSTPKQLTRSLNREIDAEHLVNGDVVRFDSFDGIEIPGILYKPHQASANDKAPALVWVHGGPGGQSTLGYRDLIQFLVNHGYVVYAINNRGSSGYGRSFQQLDDRKHGEGDLDDCVASKKMLIDTGYVDGDRIGIIGGSYGGYMVCAALAFRPDEFDVGINLFGVTNWVRTLNSIPPWWEAQRKSLEVEMGDFDDIEYLTSISPLFHASNIKKPLLVLQGANDPRVLQVESDDMVEAVRRNGVPVEYIIFDDEGHGFQKKANQLRGYQAILEFCDRYLEQGKTSE